MVWTFFTSMLLVFATEIEVFLLVSTEKKSLECKFFLLAFNIGKSSQKVLATFSSFLCRNPRMMRLGKGVFSHKHCKIFCESPWTFYLYRSLCSMSTWIWTIPHCVGMGLTQCLPNTTKQVTLFDYLNWTEISDQIAHPLYIPPTQWEASLTLPFRSSLFIINSCYIKGTVSRDLLLQVFFLNNLTPSPWK